MNRRRLLLVLVERAEGKLRVQYGRSCGAPGLIVAGMET